MQPIWVSRSLSAKSSPRLVPSLIYSMHSTQVLQRPAKATAPMTRPATSPSRQPGVDNGRRIQSVNSLSQKPINIILALTLPSDVLSGEWEMATSGDKIIYLSTTGEQAFLTAVTCSGAQERCCLDLGTTHCVTVDQMITLTGAFFN